MPHATMQLIPGIDTNKTPALNQAAFSASQLIRFLPDRNGMGLVQKLGGWQTWTPLTFSNINELHAWEDLSSVQRLAVGTDSAVYYIPATAVSNATNITPQTLDGDSPLNPKAVTISNGSPGVFTVSGNAPFNFTPVFFTTTGTLPSPLVVGTTYYVTNSSGSTFNVSATQGGSAINTTTGGSGTHTLNIAMFTTSAGSSSVTVTDVGTGVQSVTFASNTVTVGTNAAGLTGTVPALNTQLVFYGSSLPAGVTAGTTYYVVNPTTTTYKISTSLNGSPITFGAGSGTQYIPNSFGVNYSVNFQTPVSVGNVLLNGLYYITGVVTNNYFNIYTITPSVAPTLFTYPTGTAIPTLATFTLNPGLSTVLVTEPNNSYFNGATATFLYPTVAGGLNIYGNYIVSGYSGSTYTITTNAASTVGSTTVVSVNNGNVHFEYTFNIPSTSASGGFGSGQFGFGGYGIGQVLTYKTTGTITTSDWTITNFGETLIINPINGPIYYWSPTNNTQTAYLLNSGPQTNRGVFVAMPQRQLVAYGSTVTGIQDPLLITWSDAGDFTTWYPTSTNQAGSFRIPEGSLIVAAIQGPQQGLIWTDLALWAMQYVGFPNVYGFNKIADGAGAISKKCVGVMNGVVYWMSPDKFMNLTGGGPVPIMCPVWDKVFQNININAYETIRCATNSTFGEVTWFYPSLNSNECDSYVKYNVNTQQWDYGTLGRSAWIDQSVLGPPIGSDPITGAIYQHETGYDAGNDPMICSFQTGYMQLNEADSIVFVDQIWPDFKWQTADGSTTPATLYLTFYGTNYPGDTPTVYGPYTMEKTTEYLSVRIRNRLLSIGVSTSPDGVTAISNTFFRIGAFRYRYQLDGRY